MDATPKPRKTPETSCGCSLDYCGTHIPTSRFTVAAKAVEGIGLADVVKITLTGKVRASEYDYDTDDNARLEVELTKIDVSSADNQFEAMAADDD